MVVQLVESMPVEDDLCSGVGLIEDLGFAARFVLYSVQTMYESCNSPVYVVRRKIVLPYDAISPGIEMAGAFIARRAMSIAGQQFLKLVKG